MAANLIGAHVLAVASFLSSAAGVHGPRRRAWAGAEVPRCAGSLPPVPATGRGSAEERPGRGPPFRRAALADQAGVGAARRQVNRELMVRSARCGEQLFQGQDLRGHDRGDDREGEKPVQVRSG
jgi:hypothetical protein